LKRAVNSKIFLEAIENEDAVLPYMLEKVKVANSTVVNEKDNMVLLFK